MRVRTLKWLSERWKGVAELLASMAATLLTALVEQGVGTAWAVPTLRVLAVVLKWLRRGE